MKHKHKFKVGDRVKWRNPLWGQGLYKIGTVSGYNQSGKLIIDWETQDDSVIFSKVAVGDLTEVVLVEPAEYEDFKDKINDRIQL